MSWRPLALVPAIGAVLGATSLMAPGACDRGTESPDSAITDASAHLDGNPDPGSVDGPIDHRDVLGAEVTPPDSAPPGWIPMPSTPSECQVFVAPDTSRARPPPTWTPCGEGCVQYQVASPDTWTGLRLAMGAARDGTRFVAFHNNLGAGTDAAEIQVVRTNDNVVTFDGMALSWLHRCSLSLRALTSDNVLLEVFYPLSDGGQNRRTMRFVMQPNEAIPRLIFDHNDTVVYEGYAVSNGLWAASYAREWAMRWHDLTFGTDPTVGWTSPDGRAISGMQAIGKTLLASTALPGSSYATMLWNPTDGARPLVEYGSIAQGGACCVQGDGKDMVWFEGGGWSAGSPDRFSDLWLMTSPFVTNPRELQPRRLHRAHQNFLLGGAVVVGGGYALTSERRIGESISHLVLTRLSDGAFVRILPPAGFTWLYPLYVDDTELAAFQKPLDGPDSFQKPLSIVRQRLSGLGAFQPSDAGL